MNREQIAVEVLKCALAWEPTARLVGNVTALEIAELAAGAIDTCPACGATAWVNIDCNLCGICTQVLYPDEERRTPHPIPETKTTKENER